MKLNHSQYLVVNEMSETVISYDDASRLVGWLCGKRTSHLKIIVVASNGKAQVMEIGDDVLGLQKTLVAKMNDLLR
jgi:hypothetical protein